MVKISDIYYSAKATAGKVISGGFGGKPKAITNIRDKWFTYPANNLTPTSLNAILQEADTGYVWQAMELFQEIEKKEC